MIQYLLLFHMTLGQSNTLTTGQLNLVACKPIENTCEIVDTYAATSGLPGWQTPNDRNVRAKGPIPDSKFSPAHPPMYLITQPIDLRGVRGIDGNFYPIQPDRITTPVRTRSGFGLHADKNVPGTAGCIGVIDEVQFNRFDSKMNEISATGITTIPLLIDYQTIN